jgi:hypothetical protein
MLLYKLSGESAEGSLASTDDKLLLLAHFLNTITLLVTKS